MTLNETFAKSFKEGNISALELSWAFGIQTDRLHDLLQGAAYNEAEELQMLRFIFKEFKADQKGKRVPLDFEIQEKRNSDFEN